MKASNHFILTRSLSAAGQIGCVENCFRIFNKILHRRNRKFIWSAFSEFQFFTTAFEFDFWIHCLAVMCLV